MMDMNSFNLYCTLLGGLGIFYFGFRSISEVFQAEAGHFIQKSMDGLAGNRIGAILTGFMISALVQSSSAVIVSVMGLVSSNLIPLVIGISVSLGANIGGTLIAYLISIPVDKISLLFVGVSFIPGLISSSHAVKQFSRTLFSLGMLFLGMQMMGIGIGELSTKVQVIRSLVYFESELFSHQILLVCLSVLSTILLQSSVAMLGIIICFASSGLIDLKFSLLLVLGLNIGKAFPPLLASIEGNANARRIAIAHLFFNLSTASLLLIFIKPFTEIVEFLIGANSQELIKQTSPFSALKLPYMGFHIALGHTLFNITLALLFTPFLNAMTRKLMKIVPNKKNKGDEEEQAHDIFSADSAEDFLPALGLFQTHKEINNFKNIVLEMFELTEQYLMSKKLSAKLFYRIKDVEKKTDNIQRELARFTGRLVQNRLTPDQSLQTQMAMLIASELETIADYLERIAVFKTRYTHALPLDPKTGETPPIDCYPDILNYYQEIMTFYREVISGLENHNFEYKNSRESFDLFEQKSQDLKNKGDALRDHYLELAKNRQEEYRPLQDRLFSDITMSMSRLRDHIMNIAEAMTLAEENHEDDEDDAQKSSMEDH